MAKFVFIFTIKIERLGNKESGSPKNWIEVKKIYNFDNIKGSPYQADVSLHSALR